MIIIERMSYDSSLSNILAKIIFKNYFNSVLNKQIQRNCKLLNTF